MNKKDLKINAEFNKWNRINLVTQFKKEFRAFAKSYKTDKEFISNVDFNGWERIVEICNIEIENLLSSFEIPSTFYKENWLITFYEIELLKLIKNYLFPKILLEMKRIEEKHSNQRKKLSNKITKQAESDIKEITELFKIQTKFSDLKWIKESSEKDSEIYKSKRALIDGLGKNVKEDRLNLYRLILQKNDEYIREGKKSDFREVTYNVIKKTKYDFDNFYKAFNKFKKTHKLKTYEDFIKKYLL